MDLIRQYLCLTKIPVVWDPWFKKRAEDPSGSWVSRMILDSMVFPVRFRGRAEVCDTVCVVEELSGKSIVGARLP